MLLILREYRQPVFPPWSPPHYSTSSLFYSNRLACCILPFSRSVLSHSLISLSRKLRIVTACRTTTNQLHENLRHSMPCQPRLEYSEGKEAFGQTAPSSGGALPNFSEADPAQQRLKEARKKYQAELLRQMREREAEREAEKSRRKQEDEEERIRLSREIEQERLAKEEEDAWQLIRSKKLADANIAAAGPQKQRQPHQASNASLDGDVGSRHWLTGPKRLMLDQENVDHSLKEMTIRVPSESKMQPESEDEQRGHGIPRERFVQQMPATGNEVERCLLVGIEALQAEVRRQTEEMRYLKNQQRRVLQHIHQGTGFRDVCCEHQCCTADARDFFCVRHPTTHSRTTPMNANRTAEQDTFQAQYALVTTVLKNAGVSDPEDVLRRLAQCGAISMSCDPECPAVVPVNKGVPCHYNSAAHDRPEQLEGPSTREGQSCGAPHFSSIKLPLSRGMSNSSFCLIPESTQEALPQHAKDECPGSKQEGTQVEDPEERPLPTLLKRQQQPAQKQRQPDPHLRDGVVHRQPEQVQQQPIKKIKHPEGSTERECGTPVEAYVQGKWEDADERPCRAVGQTKLNTSADMPADRRWRFNDLWACLSHGFPPPPALRPIIRVRDKGCDDVLSVTNSSFISEYESELPCQTILLPHASERATPTVDKRQQCVTRHIETFSKDGWLPSSQMESLEVSTAHTHMPEENGRLIRQEQELCETFVPWVEGGGQYGGIGLANETAILMARKGTDDSRLELSNAHQERQPLMPPADADFSGSKNGLRESRLCSINDKQICRALSVDAAPLRLQQLRQWDSQIRQRRQSHPPV
ncbi:hypothetical protein, conserved [Eimeria acervulina]|uniref:CCDC66 domain-containing protein n=1 Tax=Eimeria acervulina TaxID=5801 RepID=U6G764_EIMAC|nr:hypothetical protein, conserved [Eimeria acervulina]CDI76071.1 hypothetical protein, conserved [Eimeria acervulina]